MSVMMAAVLLGCTGGKLGRPGHCARATQARIGRLLAEHWGVGRIIVGPSELALVGHYAGARYHRLPARADLRGFLAVARNLSADIVLLPEKLWPALCPPDADGLVRWRDGSRTYLAVPTSSVPGAGLRAGDWGRCHGWNEACEPVCKRCVPVPDVR